uniref:Syntaxin-binding protein 6-like n=1 Tax=Salarias fasciatus TaxID=181472 RepID=A0A672HXH5_SALFA
MNIQSTINKEVFIPQGERLLVAVEVWRRQRKRMSFLPVGAKDYSTFICVSVTNTKPHQLLITKVKQFGGSSSFVRRSQWTVEQLQQVNGINPKKDTPEFDLVFDNTVDKWVTCSSAEKCMFVQILNLRRYDPPKKTEFTNCHSKLTGGQTWHRAMGGAMGKLVQTMNVSVGKRGDTLSLAEDKTVELLQKAQQFADTAHMVT